MWPSFWGRWWGGYIYLFIVEVLNMDILEAIFYYGANILTLGVPYLIKIIIKKAIIETNQKN